MCRADDLCPRQAREALQCAGARDSRHIWSEHVTSFTVSIWQRLRWWSGRHPALHYNGLRASRVQHAFMCSPLPGSCLPYPGALLPFVPRQAA